MNQSETSAAPTPATASTTIPVRNENGTCAPSSQRRLVPVAAEIAPEPERVDDEQADGADRRDLDRVLARPVADRVREPEQDDDEDREQKQRRRVVRKLASGSA